MHRQGAPFDQKEVRKQDQDNIVGGNLEEMGKAGAKVRRQIHLQHT